MLTLPPAPDVAPFHNRQIAVLDCNQWPDWLDLNVSAKDILRSLPANSLDVVQVVGLRRCRNMDERPDRQRSRAATICCSYQQIRLASRYTEKADQLLQLGVAMKRAIFLVLITTCGGAAIGQVEDQKVRTNPNYQSHQPLGATSWPPAPSDPKNQRDFGDPPTREQSTSGYSEQEQYMQRSREWRRLQDRQQHPLATNLSGDPDARSYNPSSTSRYGKSRSYGGGSTYSAPPRPRYTPPASYGEAVRRDNSWLKPNFGSPPPAPRSTYSFSPTPSPSRRPTKQCMRFDC